MKSAIFIINPNSGSHLAREKIKAIIGELILDQFINEAEVVYTKKDIPLNVYVKKENIIGHDFVVALGGDGTINEVVNLIVASHLETPLVILQAGTVNDFANHLKIPKSSTKIVHMIEEMNVIKTDVGLINGRYFINVVAGGMFSDISYVTSNDEKKKFGPLSYGLNALSNLPKHLNRKMELIVKVDGYSFQSNARMFIVANSSHIGGVENLLPYATINDGLLDMQIVADCSTVELMQLTSDILAKKHVHNPNVNYYQGRVIEISCSENVPVDVDGEKGPDLPIKIEVLKNKLNLVAP